MEEMEGEKEKEKKTERQEKETMVSIRCVSSSRSNHGETSVREQNNIKKRRRCEEPASCK